MIPCIPANAISPSSGKRSMVDPERSFFERKALNPAAAFERKALNPGEAIERKALNRQYPKRPLSEPRFSSLMS